MRHSMITPISYRTFIHFSIIKLNVNFTLKIKKKKTIIIKLKTRKNNILQTIFVYVGVIFIIRETVNCLLYNVTC